MHQHRPGDFARLGICTQSASGWPGLLHSREAYVSLSAECAPSSLCLCEILDGVAEQQEPGNESGQHLPFQPISETSRVLAPLFPRACVALQARSMMVSYTGDVDFALLSRGTSALDSPSLASVSAKGPGPTL